MSSNNDGKWLEEKVQGILKETAERKGAYWYRFYDSKSARNILPPTPADFLFSADGTTCLLECKSSTEASSLCSLTLRSVIRPTQIGHMSVWDKAGNPGFVLFSKVNSDTFELWPWHVISAALKQSRRVKPDDDHVETSFTLLSSSLLAYLCTLSRRHI